MLWKPLAIWGLLVVAGLMVWVSGLGSTPRFGLPYVVVMLGTVIYLFGYAKPKSH
jgi:hypothetical protein